MAGVRTDLGEDWPFRMRWQRLTRGGICEPLDSPEYQRLYPLWVSSGRPRPIGDWIVRRSQRQGRSRENNR